ncbi:uncharacterized protein BYT42DRAFT_559884 [Radiomyces spectabilis]|uniref:uncharacterized protein n=1 Tax=Radiomyces spectabilis TaxID=64574 RepID=UPI00221E8739|nr:uncharacterized protein BYT42DRAFT_559884 [Radiomyces spectabilis]KAI8388375.1 hypothetical protein BYT42DRAFT_559884 [Radiomyces spectabilis]
MFDDILSAVEQEIAIEGPQGCDLDLLWEFVATALERQIQTMQPHTDRKPILDNKYKAFLWQYLRQFQLIKFILSDDPSTYLNLSTAAYDDVCQQYGSKLRIVATVESRKKLLLTGLKADHTLTSGQEPVLEAVLRARHRGINQMQLAEELNMDPRSVSHYTKRLHAAGLIDRRSEVFKRNLTILLRHTMFAAESTAAGEMPTSLRTEAAPHPSGTPINPDEALKSLTKLLSEAKDNIMYLQDLVSLMGFNTEKEIRWCRSFIAKLHAKNYVEKLKVYSEKKRVHAVRLVANREDMEGVSTPATEGTPSEMSETTMPVASVTPTIPIQSSLVVDQSMAYLIYQAIVNARECGATRNDIHQQLPAIPKRFVVRCLERLVLPGWKAYHESKGESVDINSATTTSTEEDLQYEEPSNIYYLVSESPETRYGKRKTPATSESSSAPKKKSKTSRQKSQKLASTTTTETMPDSSTDTQTSKRVSTRAMSKPGKTILPAASSATAQKDTSNETVPPATTTTTNTELPKPATTRARAKKVEPIKETITPTTTTQAESSRKRPTRAAFKKAQEILHNFVSPADNQPPAAKRRESPEHSEANELATYTSQKKPKLTVKNARPIAHVTISAPSPQQIASSSSAPSSVGPATASSSARPKKERPRAVNVTVEKRRKHLTDIVLRDRIRDLNESLNDEMTDLMYGKADTKCRLARKTLQRDSEVLHEAKTIKLIKVMASSLTGNEEMRILLMHPELNEDDQEVQDYLEQSGKAVHMEGKKHRVLKVLPTAEVERLIDRQPSVKQLEHYSHNGYCAPKKFWRSVALQFGWIQSKWLRAKELHLYMTSEAEETVTAGGETQRTINVRDKLFDIPLSLYCKLFGIFTFSNVLEKFLQDENNRHTRLGDLPDELRQIVIFKQYKLRRNLLLLVDSLVALELIEPVAEEPALLASPDNISVTYHLCDTGKIRNFAAPARPVLQEMPITTREQVMSFWEELQYTCTCVHTTHTLMNRKGPSDALSSISTPHTWHVGSLFTPAQKQILDAHVDNVRGETPSRYFQLLTRLSRETGISANRIRRYYLSIEKGFERRKQAQEQPVVLKRGNRSDQQPPAIKALLKASSNQRTVPKAKIRRKLFPFKKSTFVASRDALNLRSRRDVLDPTAKPVTRPKNPFNDIEQDLLLYAMAIQKHRSQGVKFFWAPVAEAIPGRSAEYCRRSIAPIMRKVPHFLDDVNRLSVQWGEIYRQGIAKGDIEDERPWDNRHYDLPAYLEYFLTKLKEQPEDRTQILHLPSDVQTVTNAFHIQKLTEESGHPSPCLLANKTDLFDWHISSVNDQVLLATVVIKMMMITPAESYDPDRAALLLRFFPKEIVDEAVKLLRDNGSIVYWKLGKDKRVPGRTFTVSERFLMAFDSLLPPQLYQTAAQFQRHAVDGQVIDLDKLDSGIVASTLNMLSNGNITLDFTDRERYLTLRRKLYYPKKAYTVARYLWINDEFHIRMQINHEMQIPAAPENHPSLELLTPGQTSHVAKKVYGNKSKVKFVYEALDHFGDKGANFHEIKNYVLAKHAISLDDEELYHALRDLSSGTCPVACDIGYTNQRWVLSHHASQWMVKIRGETKYVQPRMWYDIQGHVISKVLRGCCEAILGHIVLNPGISHARLLENFTGFLAPIELRDLLDYLRGMKAIRSQSIVQHGKVSLFSRIGFSNTGICTMEKTKSTHYWATKNYYMWADGVSQT